MSQRTARKLFYLRIKYTGLEHYRSNEYGTFYQVSGQLTGVNGITLAVVTIWLQRQIDGK